MAPSPGAGVGEARAADPCGGQPPGRGSRAGAGPRGRDRARPRRGAGRPRRVNGPDGRSGDLAAEAALLRGRLGSSAGTRSGGASRRSPSSVRPALGPVLEPDQIARIDAGDLAERPADVPPELAGRCPTAGRVVARRRRSRRVRPGARTPGTAPRSAARASTRRGGLRGGIGLGVVGRGRVSPAAGRRVRAVAARCGSISASSSVVGRPSFRVAEPVPGRVDPHHPPRGRLARDVRVVAAGQHPIRRRDRARPRRPDRPRAPRTRPWAASPCSSAYPFPDRSTASPGSSGHLRRTVANRMWQLGQHSSIPAVDSGRHGRHPDRRRHSTRPAFGAHAAVRRPGLRPPHVRLLGGRRPRVEGRAPGLARGADRRRPPAVRRHARPSTTRSSPSVRRRRRSTRSPPRRRRRSATRSSMTTRTPSPNPFAPGATRSAARRVGRPARREARAAPPRARGRRAATRRSSSRRRRAGRVLPVRAADRVSARAAHARPLSAAAGLAAARGHHLHRDDRRRPGRRARPAPGPSRLRRPRGARVRRRRGVPGGGRPTRRDERRHARRSGRRPASRASSTTRGSRSCAASWGEASAALDRPRRRRRGRARRLRGRAARRPACVDRDAPAPSASRRPPRRRRRAARVRRTRRLATADTGWSSTPTLLDPARRRSAGRSRWCPTRRPPRQLIGDPTLRATASGRRGGSYRPGDSGGDDHRVVSVVQLRPGVYNDGVLRRLARTTTTAPPASRRVASAAPRPGRRSAASRPRRHLRAAARRPTTPSSTATVSCRSIAVGPCDARRARHGRAPAVTARACD